MQYPYASYQSPYQQGYYQNYQQVQQPVMQPVMQQPVMPQTQQPTYSNGIIWVDDEREATMFPVGPNNAVALWEKSGKRAYMKKADATGKPILIAYDLVERAETPSNGQEKADGKTAHYATKDDLAAVVGVVKGFDELIAGMKSDIEKMSGDLYGIAGKKKTPRKQEAVEDE